MNGQGQGLVFRDEEGLVLQDMQSCEDLHEVVRMLQ